MISRLLSIFILAFIPFVAVAQDWTYDHFIDFESPYGAVLSIDSNAQVWEVGVPEKVIFDASFSDSNAIVTDLTEPYPNGVHESFSLHYRFYPYAQRCIPILDLTFQHKFDTDQSMDGGMLEFSFDGLDYYTLDDWFAPYAPTSTNNCYSSTDSVESLGFTGFSGNNGGWEAVTIRWENILPCNGDSVDVFIRFTFASDTINTEKEGWMIDDIYLTYLDVSNIAERTKSQEIAVYPNPSTDWISLEVSGGLSNQIISIINVSGQVVKQFNGLSEANEHYFIGDLPPGIYRVQVEGKERYYTSFVVSD